MLYSGIDHHKKFCVITVLNEQGETLKKGVKVSTDRTSLDFFFQSLPEPTKVVFEAGWNWGKLFDWLEEMERVEEVVLAHPQKVRVIAESQIKTDGIDSDALAQLLRMNWVPAAYIPQKETRFKKELIRQRMFVVSLRTRIKNRITALIDAEGGTPPPVTDLFGSAGREYLRGLDLPGYRGLLLKQDLRLLEHLDELIRGCEQELRPLSKQDRRVEIIGSIPGFGLILSTCIAYEMDRVDRFRHPWKLSAHSGLVPITKSTGGKTYHGRLVPSCNKWLRWAFIEGAWVAIRHSAYLRGHFEAHRHLGASKAIVVVARRISEIVWHLLKEDRLYEEKPYPKKESGLRPPSVKSKETRPPADLPSLQD